MPPPRKPIARRQHALELDDADPGPAVLGEVEDRCRRLGLWPVLGTDEVGRGPLAGPVTAAALVLRDDADLPGLNDSKLLTADAREALVPQIEAAAVAFAVVFADEAEIDQHNILGASLRAMQRAAQRVWQTLQARGAELPRVMVVDGNQLVPGFARVPQRTVVKGDARSRAIAAASVLAKVARDRHMIALDARHPGYGFAEHKGYPTPQHFAALRALGPCPVHRRSFAPVAELLRAERPEPGRLL